MIMKNLLTLESRLIRFGVRMLFASNSECALAAYRMAVDEAGHSQTGQLFYESGPGDWIELVADLLANGMQRGELPCADPHLSARQFLALLTAETRSRLYQVAPPPLAPQHVRAMVCRAVEMFLVGAEARNAAQQLSERQPSAAEVARALQ